jgi:hypothetical protein
MFIAVMLARDPGRAYGIATRHNVAGAAPNLLRGASVPAYLREKRISLC